MNKRSIELPWKYWWYPIGGVSGGYYYSHFQSPGILGIGIDTLFVYSSGGGGWYGGSGELISGSDGDGSGSGYISTALSQKSSDYTFKDKYFILVFWTYDHHCEKGVIVVLNYSFL